MGTRRAFLVMALVLRMKPIHMAAIAGILFGIGWWVWFDAVAYSKHVQSRPRKANDVHVRINMGFWAPGLMATAFLVMLMPVSAGDISGSPGVDSVCVYPWNRVGHDWNGTDDHTVHAEN